MKQNYQVYVGTKVYPTYKVYSEDKVNLEDRVYPTTLVIFHETYSTNIQSILAESSKTHINPTITSILITYSLIR